jgi:hypothetical protein
MTMFTIRLGNECAQVEAADASDAAARVLELRFWEDDDGVYTPFVVAEEFSCGFDCCGASYALREGVVIEPWGAGEGSPP